MIAEVHTMPETARLWVYQANRKFSTDESVQISIASEQFLNSWTAHGSNLKAAFSLEYDQFLVLMVDESEAGATGCSIDASVSFIKQLERDLSVSFLDRSKIAFMEKDEIRLSELNQIRTLVENGEIKADTRTFNNSVSTFGDWKRNWIQEAGSSWMKKYF